ncbi:thr operon leader peptide [Vibrio mimicus]
MFVDESNANELNVFASKYIDRQKTRMLNHSQAVMTTIITITDTSHVGAGC